MSVVINRGSGIRRQSTLLLLVVIVLFGVGFSSVVWSNRSLPPSAALHTVTVGINPIQVVADGARGHVFVLNSGYGRGRDMSTLTMLDAQNGNVLHTTALSQYSLNMIIDHATGRLFVSNDMAGTVSIIDARTGTIKGTVLVGPSPIMSVDERTGRVFVVVPATNKVGMLDARSGRVIRVVRVPIGPEDAVVDAGTGRVFIFCDTITGRTQQHPSVAVLDARSGVVLRVIPGLAGQGLVNNRTGALYLARTGIISVLNGRTAMIHHTIAFAHPYGPIAVDETSGRLFVVEAYSHVVIMVDGQTGRVLARATSAPANGVEDTIAMDSRNGHVLLTGNGETVVFDARSGKILRTIMIGGVIGVDSQTGHVFLAQAHEGRQITVGVGPLHVTFGSDAGSVSMIATT